MTVTILILVGYFVLMLAIGWIASRRIRDSRDYFLGGKGFGPWLTAFKFASTWESGVKLVGAPGMAWNVGWAGFSMGIATPICYFFSFRVFGQRLKVAFDHFNVLTLPQLLEKRYQSRTVRILAAAAIVIGLGGSLVAQFKATGEIFSVTLETSYLNGLFLGAGIVGVYCILGGYLASVWTDCLQGVLMIIGSIVIMVATATVAFGGLHWNFIPELNLSLAAIDPNLLDITGGGKIPVTQIVIIVVITGLVGLALPQQSVAIFSMRDVRTARTALVICAFFSAILAWTLVPTGMMARLVLDPATIPNPDAVIPLLIQKVLSPVTGGLFIAAILSAIMSTVSGSIVVAAATLSEDIFKLIISERYERHPVLYNRAGASFFVLVSMLLAIEPPTIIFWIGVFAFGFLVFTFLMPMIGVILLPRTPARAVIVQMVVTMIVIPIWTIVGQKATGIPALLVGLVISPLSFFAVYWLTREKLLREDMARLWKKFARL